MFLEIKRVTDPNSFSEAGECEFVLQIADEAGDCDFVLAMTDDT